MNRNVYQSLVSKLSTISPLFAKALLDVALRKRNQTPDSVTPVEILQVIREEIDPKLATELKTTNSVLLANAAVITVAADGSLIDANPAARQIFAALAKETPQTDDASLVPLLREEGFLKMASDLSGLEIRDIHKPKLGRVYNVSIAPMMGPDSKVFGTISIIQDITVKYELEKEVLSFCELLQQEIAARKRAEVLLAQQYANMAAASKMAALGLMAGGIAHEINTPLATIKLLSEQLSGFSKEDKADQQQIVAISQIIDRTVTKIAQIIRGLRFFSRDGGHDPFILIQAKDIIDDTLALCAERFRNNGIAIVVSASDGIAFECQATQISQVLLNLLNNSCDALEDVERKWIRIEVSDLGEQIEMSISDGGSGLSKKAKEMLFHPFFTTKEIGKGTGLGLSISSGIIRSHGGTLELDPNSPDTRFVIRVPKRHIQSPGTST